MKLLIAEDEPDLAEALQIFFEKNQFTVDTVSNGADAYAYAQSGGYDALILDVMMPKLNGLAVVRQLRAQGFAGPIMLLTARGEKDDRVEGFDAGADDYLPKPFAASEFLARVRALVRRSNVYAPALLTVGNTTLDGDQYMLKAPADTVRLNNKEYQLTELFFRHPRQVFSSAHLFEKIWGLDSQAEMDVVWTYISFLRRKLKQIGADVEIRTIRGAGYALEEVPC